MRVAFIFFTFFFTGCASTAVSDAELMAMGSEQYSGAYVVTRVASYGALSDVLSISLGELTGRSSRAEPMLRDLKNAKQNGLTNVVIGGNNPSLTARAVRDALALAEPGAFQGVTIMVVADEKYHDLIAPEAEQAGIQLVLKPMKN